MIGIILDFYFKNTFFSAISSIITSLQACYIPLFSIYKFYDGVFSSFSLFIRTSRSFYYIFYLRSFTFCSGYYSTYKSDF